MAIIPGKNNAGGVFINKQAQKQKKLLYVLGLLILAIIGVYLIYVNNVSILPSEPVEVAPSAGDDQSAKVVEIVQSANLDLPLLQNKKFLSLVLPGDFPIVPGPKGRQNPFAPF